eukprot:355489-Chlamydomonas_euryale.AAC.3
MVVGDAVWPCVRDSIGTSANSAAKRPSSEMSLSIIGRICVAVVRMCTCACMQSKGCATKVRDVLARHTMF